MIMCDSFGFVIMKMQKIERPALGIEPRPVVCYEMRLGPLVHPENNTSRVSVVLMENKTRNAP